MTRICLISTGREEHATAALFKRLSERLSGRNAVMLFLKPPPRGRLRMLAWLLTPRLPILKSALSADVIILHTSVAICAPEALLGLIFGKRVVVFAWDLFPDVTLYERRGRSDFATRLFGALEHRLLRRADLIVAPTDEYIEALAGRGLHRLLRCPMWPYLGNAPLPLATERQDDGTIRIAFTGKIDRARGLGQALERIAKLTRSRVEVHIFSQTSLEEYRGIGGERITLIAHGFLPESDLLARINPLDAGLVSLAGDFTPPSFPSKIFAYLIAGLPILLSGKPGSALERMITDAGIGVSLHQRTQPIDDELLGFKRFYDPSRLRFLAESGLSAGMIGRILGTAQTSA